MRENFFKGPALDVISRTGQIERVKMSFPIAGGLQKKEDEKHCEFNNESYLVDNKC